MPALNYDYDYYEYRNGRRVGSSVPQRKATNPSNRTYNVQRTVATRRTVQQPVNTRKISTANVNKQKTTNKNTVIAKTQNVKSKSSAMVKKPVPKSKATTANVAQSSKRSRIDIPLESSQKIANKPEAIKLNSPKTQNKTNSTAVLKNVALVSVFFCLFFMICYRYSVINEQFSSIKKLKTELATIQTANEQVQADIESKTDLTYVENYAKYQLGMQKPTSSQIQYVKVDKQDRISTPVSINETVEQNWFEKLFSEIRKIID